MSIFPFRIDDDSVLSVPTDEVCFYCGGPLAAPCIDWHGHAAHVWLHPACVVELCLRMLRDVHQVACQQNAAVQLVPGAGR